MNEKIINGGDFVVCDFCNGGDETMGGMIVGNSAICGDCTDEWIWKKGYKRDTDPEDYKDDLGIDEVFDREKSFKDNVLEYRLKVYGTSDAITVIKTF